MNTDKKIISAVCTIEGVIDRVLAGYDQACAEILVYSSHPFSKTAIQELEAIFSDLCCSYVAPYLHAYIQKIGFCKFLDDNQYKYPALATIDSLSQLFDVLDSWGVAYSIDDIGSISLQFQNREVLTALPKEYVQSVLESAMNYLSACKRISPELEKVAEEFHDKVIADICGAYDSIASNVDSDYIAPISVGDIEGYNATEADSEFGTNSSTVIAGTEEVAQAVDIESVIVNYIDAVA